MKKNILWIVVLLLLVGCKNPLGGDSSSVGESYHPGTDPGGVVGAPSAVTSSIAYGGAAVVADGVSTGTVVITLRDASSMAVSGVIPTFSATDTGATNIYGACSSTDSLGQSNCTIKSTVAENKTLSIQTPVVKAGGNISFKNGPAHHLVYITQPAGGVNPNVNLATQPIVEIRDQFENVVSTGVDATVTISLNLSSGNGSLTGTTSLAAIAGRATFTDIAVNRLGLNKKITATKPDTTGSGGTTALNLISNAFSVNESITLDLAAISNQVQLDSQTHAIDLTPTSDVLDCSSTYFSATSSNVSVIPVAQITFSGTWPNCKVYLEGTPGSRGTSTITIKIDNEYHQVSKSFTADVRNTGPLNKISQTALGAAYGLRRLDGFYNGKAIRVRRASDNQESDIGFTIAGDLDTVALSSFVAASTGTVVKWYDQTNQSRDLSQSTGANQPTIVNAGTLILRNSKPSILFSSHTLVGPSGAEGSPLHHEHKFVNLIAEFNGTPAAGAYQGILADGLTQRSPPPPLLDTQTDLKIGSCLSAGKLLAESLRFTANRGFY